MNGTRKIILIVFVGIVMVFAAVFLGFSYFLGGQIVAGSTQLVTNEQTKNVHERTWTDCDFNYDAFCQTYTLENVKLTSSFEGHTLPVNINYANDKENVIVIMAYGLGGNRYTNYPIAEFFLENGYNVITYDQRSSGENTAVRTTFGYWEKYDITDCIKYAKELTRGRNKIGVWGESFGGATAIQAVAYENIQEDIVFLILDCPVSSMEWMVTEEMKIMDTGLPLDYMVWCGNIVYHIEPGFPYKEAECTEIAKRLYVPTLVINSRSDKTMPYFMGKDIYDSLASAKKELWTVTDSEHVQMWRDYNEKCCSKVLALIKG